MVQDPKSIGRYQVQSLLGRGGMGSVYLALDPLLKRQLVVKVVHEGGASFAHAMERFQREAEISARLNHPNIIIVHDVGQDSACGPFIAMEYVEGATLAGLIHQQSLTIEAGLKILVQAARGLMAAAHEGIVHRDIKPENILVGKDGRVKLTDFGIARAGESKLTTVGGVFGTPSYIAPELLVDAEASPATDTYAFAVTAFELLTGSLPFKGDSVASTLLRIVNDPPSIPDTLPQAPRGVFLRALAKKPGERYPDVYSFMAALIQAYPLPGSLRSKLATLLAGEDVSLTGVPMGGTSPGRNTPLPSAQFPPPATAMAPERPVTAVPKAPSGPLLAPPAAPSRPLPRPEPPPEPPPAPEPAPEPVPRYTTRSVSGPLAPPVFSLEPEPAPPAAPTPPEPFEAKPAGSGSRNGLLAVAASATGAFLLLGVIYLVARGLGYGSRELSLDSQPTGAVVRIDGKEMGLAPLVRTKVPRRAQQVELSLPGYESKTIALLPKDTDLQTITLKPLPGTLPDGQASDDPELEAMRRKLKELEANNQREAERLRRLREQSAKPGSQAPAPAAPAKAPAPQAPAPAQQVPAAPTAATPPPAPAPAGTPAPRIVDLGPVQPPVVSRLVSPAYPVRAKTMRFEPTKPHTVVLRVFVDETGRPSKTQIVEGVPGDMGFDEAAREAALRCGYSPGSRGGRPAPGWVELTFVFPALTR